MSDKKPITFRCGADLLEALDNLGRERYHAKTPYGYDRSKILMDISRLNIEALSDGSIVLLGAVEVRQLPSNSLEERITETIKASGVIEQIRAEIKTDLRAEAGKWPSLVIATMNHERQELRAAFGQLADREKSYPSVGKHGKTRSRSFDLIQLDI
jgi:hypothetical protein